MFKQLINIFIMLFILTLGAAGFVIADIATFDDLALAPESYWNGTDITDGFVSGDTGFNNFHKSDWAYWESFAYSNRTDTGSVGLDGQYTAYSGDGSGGGAEGSANYGIGYVGFMGFPQARNGAVSGDRTQFFPGVYLTNSAYNYHSLLDGDGFAKQFGGVTGDDPDWFKLDIYGLDASYQRLGNAVEFYLADYRFADNSEDYIITDWTWVDLTSLGNVNGLEFVLSSSDSGEFGMNTPGYFALDNLASVPEPATTMLLGAGLFILGLTRRNRKKI